jgi:hypothetical protein
VRGESHRSCPDRRACEAWGSSTCCTLYTRPRFQSQDQPCRSRLTQPRHSIARPHAEQQATRWSGSSARARASLRARRRSADMRLPRSRARYWAAERVIVGRSIVSQHLPMQIPFTPQNPQPSGNSPSHSESAAHILVGTHLPLKQTPSVSDASEHSFSLLSG